MADSLDDLIDTIVFEIKLLNNADIEPRLIKKNIIHDTHAKAISLQNYPLIYLPKSIELLDIDTLVLSNTPKNLEIFDKIDQVVLFPHLRFKRAKITRGDEFLLITHSKPVEAQRLDYIDPSLYRMQNLTKLTITYRCIEAISDEIKNLEKLTYLDLSHNNITELPDVFGELKKLQFLDLSNNPLELLPNSITELNDLKHLDLSNTSIGSWNDDISEFSLSIPDDEVNSWINHLINNSDTRVIYSRIRK